MSKHRSDLEIVKDILTIVFNDIDVRKTHIMYRANLSYRLLEKYLERIQGLKLVDATEQGFFRLTEDGRSYLKECDSLIDVRNRVREQFRTVESKRTALEQLLDLNRKI